MPQIAFDRARTFLADQALPFWSTRGLYDNGCFVERLDLTGNPVDPGFTRVRVQARQIYVYSHAQWEGVFSAADQSAKALDFFIRSAWLGPDLGWAKLINRHGALIDGAYDLYDVSFALFALGWHYRVTSEKRCLDIAHATLDFLERKARHPAGGFHNDQSSSLPRQQNPHMHLVEALNVWFEATYDSRFAALAEDILVLFETKFSDPSSGALFEFFNDDWSRLTDQRGKLVEPGHQFEWTWIIGHNGRLSGKPRHALMRRLLDSGLRTGFDPESGLTVDQVDAQGTVVAASRRLWPQTEAIKASLAEAEFLGTPDTGRISSILDAIFEHFLDPAPVPGTWIDHFDSQWSPIVDNVPATSLYHISLAFLELLRLEKRLVVI